MTEDLLKKYDRLTEYLASFGNLAVAFSGGVDSAFLLYAAHDALGDKALAITATAQSFPKREGDEAAEFCANRGIRQAFVEFDEFSVEGFADNPPDRCYICKKALFTRMLAIAAEEGCMALAEGSNLDDNGDYRPGLRAIAELGVKSPLREIGFTKQEIRDLSEHFGLPTWNKQSFACLASRFPYGDRITDEKLEMVGRAEQLLLDLGFKQLRVRIHGDVARIELRPEDFDSFMSEEVRQRVYSEFKKYGFSYAALDIMGYRTGSMNEKLKNA